MYSKVQMKVQKNLYKLHSKHQKKSQVWQFWDYYLQVKIIKMQIKKTKIIIKYGVINTMKIALKSLLREYSSDQQNKYLKQKKGS